MSRVTLGLRDASRDRIRLGVDSFSFHRFFGETNRWEQPAPEQWSIRELLAYVERLGIDLLSLQSVHVEDMSESAMSSLRDDLARVGLDCIFSWGHRSGLEDGRNPQKLADALAAMSAAHALGCRIVRVVCGDQESWTEDTEIRLSRARQLRAPLEPDYSRG